MSSTRLRLWRQLGNPTFTPLQTTPARWLTIAAPSLNNSLAEWLHGGTEGLILLPGHWNFKIPGHWDFKILEKHEIHSTPTCLSDFSVGCCFPYKDQPRWNSVGTGPEEELQRKTFTPVFNFNLHLAWKHVSVQDMFSGTLELLDILWHIFLIWQFTYSEIPQKVQ